MSNHILVRDSRNEPVCACGHRPAILDQAGPAVVGVQWKAKTDVLNHIDEANKAEGNTPVRRSPEAPFRVSEQAKFPRAGVRQTPAGEWLLTCWEADRVVHVIDEPAFKDRVTAFDYGFLTIGACRQSSTNLNGWPQA